MFSEGKTRRRMLSWKNEAWKKRTYTNARVYLNRYTRNVQHACWRYTCLWKFVSRFGVRVNVPTHPPMSLFVSSKQVQGAARLLADLNLVPTPLRWWEKGRVGIIGKWTSRSFVSPWVSDCHALVEGGTNVRCGGRLFKRPYKSTKTVTRSQCRGFSWSSRGLSPLQ